MQPARPGEWLYSFPEGGQTFDEFAHSGTILKPRPGRRTIVLQPLTPLGARGTKTLESIRKITARFFACETRVADPLDLPPAALRAHRGQYDAEALIAFLAKNRPADALVYAGVADQDLYASDLNFVFGLGDLRGGLGVYSLNRFDGEGVGDDLFLERATGLLTHEIGHSFGLLHCIYFRCVMNGCNSLAEMDATPKHLCPVCLRKLAHCLGFDAKQRYLRLASAYEEFGLPELAAAAKGRAK